MTTCGYGRFEFPRLKRITQTMFFPHGNARQFYKHIGIALVDGFEFHLDSERLEVSEDYKNNPIFDHFYRVFDIPDDIAEKSMPVWINDDHDRYLKIFFNKAGEYQPDYL